MTMKTLRVKLENCYGIKKLDYTFDFSKGCASYAIYAANGSMKSSFAGVFRDIVEGKPSKDNIFPSRVSLREATDEAGVALPADSVLAIRPYNATFGESTKTATLLVDNKLRKEYEDLLKNVHGKKEALLDALRSQSGSKKNIEQELTATFTKDNNFHTALTRINVEVSSMKDAPFKDVKYDKVFDPKVLEVLGKSTVQALIKDYVTKYDELLAASTYFRKGIFNYHQAATIAKNLADNGFFEAKHTVKLNAEEALEITSQKQLEDLIQAEKDSITENKELRKKFADLDKLLYKNVTIRDFNDYITENPTILPQLDNIELFQEVVWKNYLKANHELYAAYLKSCEDAESRKLQIEAVARGQRTQWEEVIDIFNDRFFVPFTLAAKNRTQAVLGEEILVLDFTFHDGEESAPIQKKELLEVLSVGEAKALYILNLIFEIQVRQKAGVETLLVIDDIADSFDYRNKYAIIEYLKEIGENPNFKQILLTHNFDFFRTVEMRGVVKRKNCLMALKNAQGITLEAAIGIRNIFLNSWKDAFYKDSKKRIASVAFIRNMLEYTKGVGDPDYITLTSLLHLKADSMTITQKDLDAIYQRMFGGNEHHPKPDEFVIPWIHAEAKGCLAASDGLNLENKVVLSIAIRLAAEDYMVKKINDAEFLKTITAFQTTALLQKFVHEFPADTATKKEIDRVILMTPENIHLNSFMYEPILDMSDEHLRKLYTAICTLA
jgi:predicted transcriptional regulator YheO